MQHIKEDIMAIDNSRIISTVKILLAKGIDGVGIESIEKTGTSGLVDTYTITYTDSRKTTFTITNGNGITSVEKTSTSGLVDTYTITFDDGSTETFDITNGRGITKIEKTATVGNVDTYTITYNDGTTSTYEVTNGAGSTASGIIFTDNGEGATNVQDAVDNVLKLVAPIQLTLTADKTYYEGDQFVYNGLLYEVTSTIASGTAIENAMSGYMEEKDLLRDYTHATDLARVILAYTWYAKLMGKTQLDAIKLDAIPKAFLRSTPDKTVDRPVTDAEKAIIL
jgi:hypothetical protein